MEETLASPKMAEINLINNLEKISSEIPNRVLKVEDFIIKENIPINKFNISKVSNKLWGNKIKVIVEFRELTNNKNIEISLNLLKKFSQSWPKHEKPEKWIVKNKNTSTEK